MTETTLNQGSLLPKEGAGGSHWLRRTALVIFCVVLIAAIGVVFTRTIAARVPQQRATLEKLIAEHTGLAVKFDNVHFAWNLDGSSAVFTRVELTDPKANRVRVVAPELRVKFDTWDFMRHQRFSLGHVTLSSPDIEIFADPEPVAEPIPVSKRARKAPPAAEVDEAALLRRFTSWIEPMPIGRIEVEGARVHLKRRGESRSHHTFTLSQAVVSRGTSSFNAWGTMLLAQDVGQSLFVSAKLEGLGHQTSVSGELRLIARRIFLDKLAVPRIDGRGTIDAKLRLRGGRLESGTWQASAREIELGGLTRFDHLTVNGKLSRSAQDVLLDLTELQLTRGARLERVPALAVRIALVPGTTRIARTTIRAERVPFMAGELVSAFAPPQLRGALPANPAWTAVGGELHNVTFDSVSGPAPDWSLTGDIIGAELAGPDHARITQLAARLRWDTRALALEFDPATQAALHFASGTEPRLVSFAGALTFTEQNAPALRFDDFVAHSGASRIEARGEWHAAARAQPLAISVAHVDRALAGDLWGLMAGTEPPPQLLSELTDGNLVAGTVALLPARGSADVLAIDWQRSRGKLELERLAIGGHDTAQLADGQGTLDFARGAAQLRLVSARVDDLTLTRARLDWPRVGPPRLRASLAGTLDSALVRRTVAAQGLERLHGAVEIEADARGERALRDPALWRVTARIRDGSLALAEGTPPVEKIAGTVRYADSQLRALDLEGRWLGGPVEFEARRASGRGALNVSVNGATDTIPLLRVLGQEEAAGRVSGQLAWSGSAQRLGGDDSWRLTLTSNLTGVESRLAEPFAKTRARAMPVSAELRVDGDGIRDFVIESDRDVSIRGEVRDNVATAKFALLGITGQLRRETDPSAESEISVDRIDLKRVPALLAAAQTFLPVEGTAVLTIGDLRYADHSFGVLRTAFAHGEEGVRFEVESDDAAPHRIVASGLCAAEGRRCSTDFTFETRELASLVRDVRLPPDWPTASLHAKGTLSWPDDPDADITRTVGGTVELEAHGRDSGHELIASATLADGQIRIASLQGAGPDPTQVFRGTGRIGIIARDYDLTIDYERVSPLAATAVPTPARARFARAWNTFRGSVARRGWTDAPEGRRVQWHGYWDVERPD